jgi:hypothetical protein
MESNTLSISGGAQGTTVLDLFFYYRVFEPDEEVDARGKRSEYTYVKIL